MKNPRSWGLQPQQIKIHTFWVLQQPWYLLPYQQSGPDEDFGCWHLPGHDPVLLPSPSWLSHPHAWKCQVKTGIPPGWQLNWSQLKHELTPGYQGQFTQLEVGFTKVNKWADIARVFFLSSYGKFYIKHKFILYKFAYIK